MPISNHKKNKSFLGVELNEGIYFWNLLGAYLCNFAGMAIIEFNSTFFIYLLQSPDYFDMDSKEAARVFGNIVFYTQLVIVFGGDITTGFLFELIGRKAVIFGGII